MFNQSEIDSKDQLDWRRQRTEIYERLRSFCAKNQVGFATDFNLDWFSFSPYKSSVYCLIFDLIPPKFQWEKVNEICKKQNKKIYVVTDNLLDWKDLDNVKFYSFYEILGITANFCQTDVRVKHFSALYNCFIQRTDSVRQSWLYLLYHKNLLQKGYVSYLLKQLVRYSGKTGVDLFDHIHFYYGLDQLPHFHASYLELRPLVPYRNFDEIGDLVLLTRESKYNLILETYATEDDTGHYCFTEKSLRPLQFATNRLIFTQKHALEKLKKIGIMVDFTDHDTLSWHQRQQALLHRIEHDKSVYSIDQLTEQALHNRDLLLKWKHKVHATDFFDKLFDDLLST